MSCLMQLEEEKSLKHWFQTWSLEVKPTFTESFRQNLSYWESQLLVCKEHQFQTSCCSNGTEKFQQSKNKRFKNSIQVFWKTNWRLTQLSWFSWKMFQASGKKLKREPLKESLQLKCEKMIREIFNLSFKFFTFEI